MQKSTYLCVITTICGTGLKYLHPAPSKFDCYVFTNNPALRREAMRKGWIIILFSTLKQPALPNPIDLSLTNDVVQSSNQSKYVKFLQIMRDNPNMNLWKYSQILYVDHKIKLQNHHFNRIRKLREPSKGIIIRKTPRLKMSVWDEFRDAHGQQRYRRFEFATRVFINDKLAQGYQSQVRICQTGFILYDMSSKPLRDQIMSLTSEVYSNLRQVGTPECQIIWALVAQKYVSLIQTIECQSLSLLRKVPTQ